MLRCWPVPPIEGECLAESLSNGVLPLSAGGPAVSQIKYKALIARSPQSDAAISSYVGTLSTRLLRFARNDQEGYVIARSGATKQSRR